MHKEEKTTILSVSYTIRDSRGLKLDDSRGKTVDIKLGEAGVIPGLSDALRGMVVGERVEFFISGREAYGAYSHDLVEQVSLEDLKGIENLEKGTMLDGLSPEGGVFPVVVTAIEDDTVTLDANHPLAGVDVYADIEIVRIVESDD